MKYKYEAINANGERIKGEKESTDKFLVAKDLQAQGLSPLLIEEKKKGLNFDISFFNNVKIHEKITFAKNLAAMLKAGLPVSRALTIIERQLKNKFFKKIIKDTNEGIKKGVSLSESLKKYPKIFPQIFVSMVAAGEESGKLSESLGVVSSQMEKTYLLQKKVKGALIYPSIIVFAMTGIGIFMLVYIVPTLASTFKELGTELPASTRFIIYLSDSFQAHFVPILLGVALIIFGIMFLAKSRVGRKVLDLIVLRIPVISELVKETYSARTARTLSSLLSSGVSVVDALGITKDVLQNSYYKSIIEEAKKSIQIGSPISDVFSKAEKFYPIFVAEMISVGEETGDLGGTLMNVAEFYENEVEQKTKDMSTIIEPVLMLIVGVAVGFFAISMISPIYSVADKI